MDEIDTGIAFFGVVGFIVFIWGGAWLGFKIEESVRTDREWREIAKGKRQSDETSPLPMGDSLGAFIGGGVALVVALVIRYGI
jgi:hypothetical protein